MNAQLQNLILRQQQYMRELRDDAGDIVNVVADEVWDKFEVEIEEITEDGYMFDMAQSTQMMLASMLAISYEEAFERHVLGLFAKYELQLREANINAAGFDGAHVDLTGMRKSLKLRRHANEMIGQAIERAKPGLIGMIFLSTDPCSDAWEREQRDNARRLRRKLLELRSAVIQAVRDETGTVIQSARLAYTNMLDSLHGNVVTAQTVSATC